MIAITFRKDTVYPATSKIAVGSKLGIDATKKHPGEGFKPPGLSRSAQTVPILARDVRGWNVRLAQTDANSVRRQKVPQRAVMAQISREPRHFLVWRDEPSRVVR